MKTEFVVWWDGRREGRNGGQLFIQAEPRAQPAPTLRKRPAASQDLIVDTLAEYGPLRLIDLARLLPQYETQSVQNAVYRLLVNGRLAKERAHGPGRTAYRYLVAKR